ncbi:MAG TPA: hypothetical protein VMI30_09200 [Stellaceae bacterium]|nr:hypothetical protein [Stellaceae bacterium]
MSDLDDALAVLERAVSRLEAAQGQADSAVTARVAAARDAEHRQIAQTAAEIIARVDAALAKIGQVLDGDG